MLRGVFIKGYKKVFIEGKVFIDGYLSMLRWTTVIRRSMPYKYIRLPGTHLFDGVLLARDLCDLGDGVDVIL